MTHEESIAEAQRLLLEAGSQRAEVRGSHPYWLVVCDWGVSATSPEDHTFDEPHECAAALVAQWGKSGHDAGHETDSEIVPEGPPDVGDPIWRDPAWASGDGLPDDGSGRALSDHGGDDLHSDEPEDAAEELAHKTDSETPAQADVPGPEQAAGGELGGSPPDDAGSEASPGAEPGAPTLSANEREAIFPADAEPSSPEATDAAFIEIAAEGADLDPLLLPEPDPQDFVPDEIIPDKVAEAVAIFGDDLPMARLILIGRVTQIAGELKAILQEGWSVPEFAELQNQIMRMSEGLAPDDEHARARFAAISEASRAMSAIDAHAERQVEWINGASRDEIASYKPEENWP